MLPHLELGSSPAGRTVMVPPPLRFKPLSGCPHSVSIRRQDYRKALGLTLAQKAGLSYEQKVQTNLLERYKGDYTAAPNIRFLDDNGARTVIPDGIILFPNRTYVIEIKLQHMPEAWWQLDQLYRPVVQARNLTRPVTCIEIVKSYDPSMPFPCEFDVIAIESLVADEKQYKGSFGVVPWKL